MVQIKRKGIYPDVKGTMDEFLDKLEMGGIKAPQPVQEIVFESNGQPVTSSTIVAQEFEKRHDHVLRDIREMLEKDVPKIGEMFVEVEFPDSYGRPQPAFMMNRDGFSLLTMGFTGEKALKFKVDFIEAFNKMEAIIREKQQFVIPKTFSEALILNPFLIIILVCL